MLSEPGFNAIRFDVLEAHFVNPRRAVVRTAASVRVTQHVLSVQLVVQRVEPTARLVLRFGM
jgi:pentose-5-phosphate-3-epimerase